MFLPTSPCDMVVRVRCLPLYYLTALLLPQGPEGCGCCYFADNQRFLSSKWYKRKTTHTPRAPFLARSPHATGQSAIDGDVCAQAMRDSVCRRGRGSSSRPISRRSCSRRFTGMCHASWSEGRGLCPRNDAPLPEQNGECCTPLHTWNTSIAAWHASAGPCDLI